MSSMNAKQPKARVLAFYLPQYHPIPENDKWWGKGFTEWTNVGKAKPLFPGHYQPHVPADLGYYDLRVPETREAQAQMAREYGIEGFIYWHYWFGNGKQLLERPFNEVLQSGEPDFPFALAWANESWSGTFHGLKKGNTLIEQLYPGDEDYINHFYKVLPAFKDKRYIQCDGMPLFFIYRPRQCPDVDHFIALWQQLARDNGLKGVFFVGMASSLYSIEAANRYMELYQSLGFSSMTVINAFNAPIKSFSFRVLRKVFFKILTVIPDIRPYEYYQLHFPLDDNEFVFPTILSNWDHTPRTGKRGIVSCGTSPERFQVFLRRKLDIIRSKPYDRRFLLIKSWNEWAEGNHLEPDLRYGKKYLEVIKQELF